MPIDQSSAGFDLQAAANQAFASGQPVRIGLVRVRDMPGPWTFRMRYVLPGGRGPGAFLPSNGVPSVQLNVQEGSERGQHEWASANQGIRDFSIPLWSSSFSIDAVVPSNFSAPEPCSISAWVERGPAPKTALPGGMIIAPDDVTFRSLVPLVPADTTIPPDAHAVELSLPTSLGSLTTVAYPAEVVQYGVTGTDVLRVPIAAAAGDTVRCVLTPNARWVAFISPAPSPVGFFPCVYHRH